MLHEVYNHSGCERAAGHVGPRGARRERNVCTSLPLGTYNPHEFGNVMRVFGIRDKSWHPLKD